MVTDWVWNGETERWEFVFQQQRRFHSSALRRGRSKFYVNRIEVSVAKALDGRDAQLRACASSYAARLSFLQDAIATYLTGRPIKVYGGYEDPTQYTEIIHPEQPAIDIRSIEIPDALQPERVHVFVDTGYPDPYFFYEIMFEDMVAVDGRGEVC